MHFQGNCDIEICIQQLSIIAYNVSISDIVNEIIDNLHLMS